LIVKQIMLIRRFASCLETARALISRFEKSKADRQELRRLQHGKHEYTLVKPCDTRWSSHLRSCSRLLRLKPYLQLIAAQPDAFWSELELLVEFLKPFQVATDVLQKDSATVLDVWVQKRALEQHIDEMQEQIGASTARYATAAVQQRWEKQVNQPATHACTLLSLIADTSHISERELAAARQFILQFGAGYLVFFNLAGGAPEASVRAALLHQLGSFIGRRDQYTSMVENIATARLPNSGCSALDVWAMYRGELPAVATALLSITASEAAVERSFSAQDAVHTDKRNKLLDKSVQDDSEMFVKFNTRALDRQEKPPELESFSCIDL